MVLLTFLGTGSNYTGLYELANYQWYEHQPIKTRWIAEACIEIFDIKEAYIIATQKAQDLTWPNLKAAIQNKCDLHLIPIKVGKSEAELWDIFELILDPIPEGAELIIDVTHGFRSQPLMALAIAIYLRIVKGIVVRHIVYGAWEAKDKNSDITPIFALDAFLELIDWTFAISTMSNSGDAAGLKQILQETQKRYYVERSSKYQNSDLPRKLVSLAGSLYQVSQALQLLRPGETGKQVRIALKLLQESRQELQKFAKPFSPLVDRIEVELKPLDYGEVTTSKSILEAQLSMIDWFLSKKKFSHAITLAREWGVNYFAVLRGLNPAVNRHRKLAEKWLNQLIYEHGESDYQGILSREFANLFREIQNYRNEINHANDEQPANKLAKNIEKVCQKLLENSKNLMNQL